MITTPWSRASNHVNISFCLVMSTLVLASSSSRWAGIQGSSTFDESIAREIVNFTQAAYCTDQLISWNCTVCQSFPGMTNVSILQGKSRNVRGFVGVDVGVRRRDNSRNALTGSRLASESVVPDAVDTAAVAVVTTAETARRRGLRVRDYEGAIPRPRVVVTFSGTDPKSIKNWIDDIEAAPIAHAYGGCEDCKVHRGFLAAYEVVKEQIRASVASHLQHNPTAEILITGHSLGGALATLCFLDLQESLSPKELFAPLYIFGSPRVGNSAFATYSASRGVPIFRVVHNRDPVPHLPFEAWGYVHPPREVFFDAPQTSHVVCDESGEDPECSDQFWVMPDLAHVHDHLAYLEVDYTKAYIQCVMGLEGPKEHEDEAAAAISAETARV